MKCSDNRNLAHACSIGESTQAHLGIRHEQLSVSAPRNVFAGACAGGASPGFCGGCLSRAEASLKSAHNHSAVSDSMWELAQLACSYHLRPTRIDEPKLVRQPETHHARGKHVYDWCITVNMPFLTNKQRHSFCGVACCCLMCLPS